MQALRDEKAGSKVVTVGRELTGATRYGLIDGTLDVVISHPMKSLAELVVAALSRASTIHGNGFQQHVLPFDIIVRESL